MVPLNKKVDEVFGILSKSRAKVPVPVTVQDILMGLTSRDKGCETTLTFDKKAARLEPFTLI